MEKFKRVVLIIASVLFEHITLFATIIASVYILTKSQLDAYDNNTLLLWVIGLLGLIATAIVSEKYFKLSKIARGIEDIQSSIKNSGLSLDELAFTRKELKPLEVRLSQAKKITITGGSLYRLSDEYYAFFESKLKNGCQLEIVMVKPYSSAADLLCDNVVYETKDYKQYSFKISESLQRFLRLKQEYNSGISIRLAENVPPFSLIVTDEDSSNASIKVELYSYSVPTRERMQFEVTREDAKSFAFFIDQLITIRRESNEIDTSYSGILPSEPTLSPK